MQLARIIFSIIFFMSMSVTSLYASDSTIENVKEKTKALVKETKEKTVDATKKILDKGSEVAADLSADIKEKTIHITERVIEEGGDVTNKVIEETKKSGTKALGKIKELIEQGADAITDKKQCKLGQECSQSMGEVIDSI